MEQAAVHEIFASIQGEGPWLGERHIFVRLQGCDMQCRYCDTPASVSSAKGAPGIEFASVQSSFGTTASCDKIPNPVSAARLSELCSRLIVPGPSRPTLSLTGGEPLLQHEFLSEWLPIAKKRYRVYLETNGIRHEAMKLINGLVDVVSMDFKLPSATGLRPFWEEHERFLSSVGSAELFVKAVVTRDTKKDDILTSARLIAGRGASIPLVLQPAGGTLAPDAKTLIDYQEAALGILPIVRVIPQVHKMLKVP
jgi:organic radical activating enzyme